MREQGAHSETSAACRLEQYFVGVMRDCRFRTESHYYYIHRVLCLCVVIDAGDKISILSAITKLKTSLAEFIEPDFGLLSELLRLHVLTKRQVASVRSERTVYDRNDVLLELLTSENQSSEEQCIKFLTALRRTGQHHVVNFITQNGGQKHKSIVM